MSENPFVAYLKRRLPLVESALGNAAAAPLAHANEPARDLERYLYAPLAAFTEGGGKRVRPVLCLLGAEAVGGEPHLALAPAMGIELFQSAALIHDDIADESELRRGKPCLYLTEGTGLATNMGDLALTQVIEVVLADGALPQDRKAKVLGELVSMERHTLEGQALDLGWARDGRWDVTEADYLYMVRSKTAHYTAASPLAVGAVAAGATPEAVEGLRQVGISAGIAFQLQDDLLNLVGDVEAQGKDFRSDITEGKRTLAVVYALASLDTRDREELVAILEDGTTNADELARAVELIEAGGGIAHCSQLAEREARRAEQGAHDLASRGLVTHGAAELLCAMAQFFVRRAS